MNSSTLDSICNFQYFFLNYTNTIKKIPFRICRRKFLEFFDIMDSKFGIDTLIDKLIASRYKIFIIKIIR